jgi:hypothetical protein
MRLRALWWLIRRLSRRCFQPTPQQVAVRLRRNRERILENLYKKLAKAQLELDFAKAQLDHVRTMLESENGI